MAKNQKVENIPLSSIEADEKQPRKNFSPERLSELMKSIKKHGIMNPLIVEKTKTGKYILVDGERRYRSAKELDLKEVPVIVVDEQSEVERLIQQFHLQEQHEGWSALEKALAVSRLADDLGIGIANLAETLSLPKSTVGDYVAFSKLLEKKEYIKSEISINYARSIRNLKNFLKEIYKERLNEEFDEEMQRGLELAIISRVKSGNIEKGSDILKIYDSAKVDPRSVEKFIKNPKLTTDKLFLESNAKVAWYYRNIYNQATTLATYIRGGLPLKVDSLFTDRGRASLIALKKQVDELVNKL